MTDDELRKMRHDYSGGELSERDIATTWLEQFMRWLAEVGALEVPEPNAMVFATSDPQGHPSARTVLLKHVDENGFVLFTNLTSRKGSEATANPWASLVFPWFSVERQVVVCGRVETVTPALADRYFAERPYESRLGAWASQQSRVLPDRATLDESYLEMERRFPREGEVPRPEHWGGLRVVPQTVEFWRGRPSRLHDRLRYRADDGVWRIERLAP